MTRTNIGEGRIPRFQLRPNAWAIHTPPRTASSQELLFKLTCPFALKQNDILAHQAYFEKIYFV